MIIELSRALNITGLCEVKRCPFCGGEPRIEYKAGDYLHCTNKVQIKCKSCGATIVCEDTELMSDENLIKLTISKWNDRANEAIDIFS